MINLVLQSIRVRKKKFSLLMIEFVVGFVSLIYGLNNIDNLYRYKNTIEHEISLDTIHVNINQDNIFDISLEDLQEYNIIINRIKKIQEVDKVGLFQTIYAYKNVIPLAKEEEKLYMLNNDMIQIMNFKVKEGSIELLTNYKREDDIIPILVSDYLKNQYPLHKTFTMYMNYNNELLKKTFKVVGILTNNMCFFYGGQSVATDSMLSNTEFIITPYFFDFNSQIPFKHNMFISNHNNDNTVLDDIKESFLEYDIMVSGSTIQKEISLYYDRQKPIIIYTILFSIILLSLSIIGCIGTILSSIIYRKKEFGIYFSLGFTKINLCQFICGEIVILLFLCLIIAILIDIIIFNILLKDLGMTVSYYVIMRSSMIMILCALFCLILPIRKISKINPIDLLNERNK